MSENIFIAPKPEKRIDLALALKLDHAIAERSSEGDTNHWNVFLSSARCCSHRPLSLYIKVNQNPSITNALMDLGAWAAANFKLRLNTKWDMDRPVLGLMIQETDWKLFVFVSRESRAERRVCTWDIACVKLMTLGGTNDPDDIRKLFANLHHVLHWCKTVFLTWFEREASHGRDQA